MKCFLCDEKADNFCLECDKNICNLHFNVRHDICIRCCQIGTEIKEYNVQNNDQDRQDSVAFHILNKRGQTPEFIATLAATSPERVRALVEAYRNGAWEQLKHG